MSQGNTRKELITRLSYEVCHVDFFFSVEEDVFIQKINDLSSSDHEVTVMVCYDDFNPYKNLRSEIDEEQHFLFNRLRKQFASQRNITLEFVYVWDVLELLPQLAEDNVNTFIFDFTFNDRSDDNKMTEYVKSYSVPKVKTG